MIYDEPAYRPLGDTAFNVEFGDEISIPVNFRILQLDLTLRTNSPEGLIGTNPQVRTLGVIYNPLVTRFELLRDHIKELVASLGPIGKLPSRRIVIPAWYDDPWSRECAAAFGVQVNIEYMAEFNGISVAEVIRRHTSSDFWVTGVGFVPGAFLSYALDPRVRVGAPLYRTPRTWTYSRLLNCGGVTSTIYPFRTPGGGQLFGRTPLNIFEPAQKNKAFRDGPVLTRAGDRLHYVSIDAAEYYEIRSAVEMGTYDYQIEDDIFDASAYLNWLTTIETNPVAPPGTVVTANNA